MIDPMCKTTVFFKLRGKKEVNYHETISTLMKERIDDTLEDYVITEQLQHQKSTGKILSPSQKDHKAALIV